MAPRPPIARTPLPRPLAALGGVMATAAALGAGELLAGLLPGIPAPIVAVGRLIVDLQPPGAKDVVVSLFGTADKLALQVVIVVVALAIGAALGIVARTRPGLGTAAIAAFAAFGFVAALRDPAAVATLAAGGALAETLVGVAVLSRLVPPASGAATETPADASMPEWSRRRLLIQGAGVGAAAIVAAAVGRDLLARRGTGVAPKALPVASTVATLPAGASLDVPGITPVVVPNPDFYRIDTALLVPDVDVATWRLSVTGMVERTIELTYAELSQLPLVEEYVTIACVSNEVGGGLVGNAKWSGVRLRDVLSMAGVKSGATQLVGRSADGWTAGMPTAWVMDPRREPLIALGMNGVPLPREHGYPARLIVPGLYGYVSATKWLTELQLTTLEAVDGYWVPLGWAKEAPILTQSRIDVPRRGSTVAAGRTPIAGVAWAPDRGIRRVEVAVDGAWRDATISTPISDATWVQWVLPWDATRGDHRIEVRATDGTGTIQTADVTRPAPDGARGHHTITVTVS